MTEQCDVGDDATGQSDGTDSAGAGPEGAGGSGADEGGADERGGRPCPVCDRPMTHRHCKYVCPEHGVVYDCSDTFY